MAKIFYSGHLIFVILLILKEIKLLTFRLGGGIMVIGDGTKMAKDILDFQRHGTASTEDKAAKAIEGAKNVTPDQYHAGAK